ncbi:hypothetical protein FisN_21Lh187 [Fistulifera solaris]|uniref:Uncharacterized protein n=1 Tax=Fistulifera solaris TaxID=1519565 RepID=A0A1Z5J956_FISSO|nr:hypothetical protein FisN_21Lh187 [Fistulifera solaris]|eukprot:GAX10486.1 hypothetical protein FisN_21Lh187 [Fistulifera solaris]
MTASNAPASAAGSSATSKMNDVEALHEPVETQELSAIETVHNKTKLSGQGPANFPDELPSCNCEAPSFSSALQMKDPAAKETTTTRTCPPKKFQQVDDTLADSLPENDEIILAENKLKTLPSNEHEKNSSTYKGPPIVDTGNPRDGTTNKEAHNHRLSENRETPDTPVLQESQNVSVGNSRPDTVVVGGGENVTGDPSQQKNLSDPTMMIQQNTCISQQVPETGHQFIPAIDAASIRRPAIVEGTPVLPVIGIPVADNSALASTATENVTQSQLNLIHTVVAPEGATVVGMVGTTPIVRLPDASKRLVTKKKGRFKVFQPVIDVVPVDSTSSSPSTTIQAPTEMALADPNMPTVGGQETTGGADPEPAMLINQPPLPSNNPDEPQTFEGTGAPVVKRKGRFFVTNLKDPAVIAINIQPQMVNGVPISNAPATQTTVESYQLTSTYVQTSAPNIAVAPGAADLYQSVATAAPSVNSQTVMLSTVPVLQQHHPQPQPPQPVQYDHSVVSQHHSGVHVQETFHLDRNTQRATEPRQSSIQQPNVTLPGGAEGTNLQSDVWPAESQVASEKVDSPSDRPIEHSEASQNQKPLARRYQSVPKSGREEHLAPTGLGKVFHFLDQMRTEVTQADKLIKTLQTENRLLKERNKELEAKVIDGDRKFREEKAFREATDAKLKALRKKVRSMKEGSEIQKEDDSTLTTAQQSENAEADQKKALSGSIQPGSGHAAANQKANLPLHDGPKKSNHAAHSLPATPDTKVKSNATSPELMMLQVASDKELPPTPPFSRRKGSSSSNVPVPKPSPSHSRVKSTPHLPTHSGFLNNGLPNQLTRNSDTSSTSHYAHVPQSAGVTQREHRAPRLASTEFDPLAPKKASAAQVDSSHINFDPFSSVASPNQHISAGLQSSNGTPTHVIQPTSLFTMNQTTVPIPVHSQTGTSFELFDYTTIQNQPKTQQDLLQQSNCQESHQQILLVPQQTLEVLTDNQMYPNALTMGSASNVLIEQNVLNVATSGMWGPQPEEVTVAHVETQPKSDFAQALASQSRLSLPLDPFDDLLSRVNQS